MNQLAIEFQKPCVVPPANSQHGKLLRAMQMGMRPTIKTAGPVLGIGALSQRIGDLKDMGWPIKGQRVKGKSYWEYWL